MKRITLLLAILCIAFSAHAQGPTMTVNPDPFVEDQMITITLSNFDPMNEWGVSDIYLWSWVQDGPNFSNNGMWANSDEAAKLTDNMDGTYSISFIPLDSYENNPTEIGTINMIFKALDGEVGKIEGFSADSARVLNTTDFDKDTAGARLNSTYVTTDFSFNTDLRNVSVFNTAGILLRSFRGDFATNTLFDISGLTNGLYIIQAENTAGSLSTFQLIKN